MIAVNEGYVCYQSFLLKNFPRECFFLQQFPETISLEPITIVIYQMLGQPQYLQITQDYLITKLLQPIPSSS